MRYATLVIAVLLSARPISAMADDICGPDAYIDSTRYTDEKEIVTCACAPGFNHARGGCERTVPDALLEISTLFLPIGEIGIVNAYIEHDGKRIDIPESRIFYANLITTGQESLLTAYVGNDMRIRVAAETQLRLGEFVPDFSLVIDDLKGMFRLDNHFSPDERKKAAALYGRIKAYLRKATSRRFNIRAGNVAIGVRGSDLIVAGGDDGALAVHVLSGPVTLESHDGKRKLELRAGDSALAPKNAPPRLIGHDRRDAIETLWRNRIPAE
jgi:hypothetical protein